MSRTTRRARPKFWRRKGVNVVRDGADQYVSVHCQHNNACPHCVNTRTHASKRRKPIEEV